MIPSRLPPMLWWNPAEFGTSYALPAGIYPGDTDWSPTGPGGTTISGQGPGSATIMRTGPGGATMIPRES